MVGLVCALLIEYQDGRAALHGILGPQGYQELVQIAEQGVEHGGISIFTPVLSRLLHVQQYRGEQPQFIHRWLFKQMLSQGVQVVHGRRIRGVDNTPDGVRMIFTDETIERADLVIGGSQICLRRIWVSDTPRGRWCGVRVESSALSRSRRL